MIDASHASNAIELPERIAITCYADGRRTEGLLALLTLVMNRKNDHVMVLGPSDRAGKVVVERAEIAEEVERDLRLFPMDYEGAGAFSGDVIVAPMNLRDVEAALKAHDVFGDAGGYAPDHRAKLGEALKNLYRRSFRRLETKAVVPSRARRPDVHVKGRSIVAV